MLVTPGADGRRDSNPSMQVFLFSFTRENDSQGVDHNFQVEGDGNVFNVNKIVRHSLDHLCYRGRIPEFYHAPAGKSWFYFKQVIVFRVLLHDLFDIEFTLWAGAN